MDYIWGQSISLSLLGGEGLDGGSLGCRGGSWMNQGPSHTSFLLSLLGWRRARPRWAKPWVERGILVVLTPASFMDL